MSATAFSLMGVFADYILMEKPVGAGIRCCRKANQEGIEILDDLPPEIVDGAVTFADHDNVESFGWAFGIANNGQWFFAAPLLLLRVLLLCRFIQWLALERSSTHRPPHSDRSTGSLAYRAP